MGTHKVALCAPEGDVEQRGELATWDGEEGEVVAEKDNDQRGSVGPATDLDTLTDPSCRSRSTTNLVTSRQIR